VVITLAISCAFWPVDRRYAALPNGEKVTSIAQSLHASNHELVLKEHDLRTLLSAAPIGIAQFDKEGRCVYLNPAACKLVGYNEATARGRRFLVFVHPDDRDYVDFVSKLNMTDADINWLEFRLNRTNIWISARWINLLEAGQFSGSIVIFIDNSEQRNKDQQLWVRAYYDMLTDLPNRNLFWERLDQHLRRATRANQLIALLWIDLDGFKSINDHLGHAAGDEVLQQAAQRLQTRVRDSDTVARMGGDEFTVILPDIINLDAALQVAQELTTRLAEPFLLQSGPGQVSASVGLALYPLHANNVEDLVKRADLAMYTAKKAGKNQVAVWQNPGS